MPVLEVRALPQKDPRVIPDALSETCLAIARVYPCEPSQVWATWETIDPQLYCEGTSFVDVQPRETHPPLCKLTCFEGKTDAQIEKTLLATGTTLSAALGIPGNVFMTYHEAKSGHVLAGNGVVRK